VSVKAPVNRILPSSIVDGPGNRAVVFLQGCNFNCVYCHNPETIAPCCACGDCLAVCPAGALSRSGGGINWQQDRCVLCDACLKICAHNSSPRIRYLSPEEVMSEIEPSIPFIRGITVSGGECTLRPEFLRRLGELAHKRRVSFFLDSNGGYAFSEDPALMAHTDKVMLDIKADPDNPDEYRRVTGNDGALVSAQADFLAGTGKLWEIRTVVSPGLFDAAAVVDKLCRRISGIEPSVQYKLIRYRPMGVRREAAGALRLPGEDLMNELERICAGHGVKAVTI
jgi:pyruvate formate lyase activating enzyme